MHHLKAPDFGRTASDYGEYRAGFPAELVDRLLGVGVVRAKDRVLDVGTGTGSLARLLAPRVRSVLGLDPSEPFLEGARSVDDGPPNITYELDVKRRSKTLAS